MNVRRLLFIVCAVVALVAIVFFASSLYWQHNQGPFQNAPRLIGALDAFLRDQRTAGRPLPPEVSLQDLLRGRYLAPQDVRGFEGMEVTFSTQMDAAHPQAIVVRARMPDGQFVCLLADGSVQQFTSARLKEALENSVQSKGTTNGNAGAER